MKDVHKNIITILLLIVLIILSLFLYKVYDKNKVNESIMVAEEAVMCMYNFTDAYNLADNMVRLKELCEDNVYKQLTIDNKDRTLQTYLKFKGEPVSVNFINSTSSYIMYSLETKYISEDRKFVMFYEVYKNKLSAVREMECVDFV